MNRDEYFDRYAISTFLYRRYPLEDALRRISAAGFRWVELWGDRAHLDPRLGSVDVDGVKRLLGDLGLMAHSMHTPFNDMHLGQPASNDPEMCRRFIGEAIRWAGALGARAAVVHPTSDPVMLTPEQQPISRQIALDLVGEMIQVAEEAGTRVALENVVYRGHWRFGTSMEMIGAEFTDPRVGFCLDVGHATLNGKDIGAEARATNGRLVSIHVANNEGNDDSHLPPDRGVMDWPRAIAALDEAGYTGRFVLETSSHGDADGMLAHLSRLWEWLP